MSWMANEWRLLALCVLLLAHGAAALRPRLQRAGQAALVARGPAVEPGTAIITLGQSLQPDGSPAATMVSRVEAAAALHRELGAPLVVCGGDPAGVGVTEAEAMRRLLVERGVPAADVHLERESNNTVQNAVFAIPILRSLGARRVLLVSSDFHLPRASYIFEAVFASLAKPAEFELEPRAVHGGCPSAPAAPGEGINRQSLVQRLEGEEGYISWQLQHASLHSEMPGVRVPAPGRERLERALGEVRAQLEAAERDERGGARGGASASPAAYVAACLLLQAFSLALPEGH